MGSIVLWTGKSEANQKVEDSLHATHTHARTHTHTLTRRRRVKIWLWYIQSVVLVAKRFVEYNISFRKD